MDVKFLEAVSGICDAEMNIVVFTFDSWLPLGNVAALLFRQASGLFGCTWPLQLASSCHTTAFTVRLAVHGYDQEKNVSEMLSKTHHSLAGLSAVKTIMEWSGRTPLEKPERAPCLHTVRITRSNSENLKSSSHRDRMSAASVSSGGWEGRWHEFRGVLSRLSSSGSNRLKGRGKGLHEL